MQFEWDEKKRKVNLAKHGIDFADLEPLFGGLTITVLDDVDAPAAQMMLRAFIPAGVQINTFLDDRCPVFWRSFYAPRIP